MGFRIACVTDCYTPYKSGVVHSILTLNRELLSMGHEVAVFAPAYPDSPVNEPGVYRFSSIPAPTNRDYYLAIPFSRRLRDTLYRMEPDIIHIHHPFGLGWAGVYHAGRLGIPLVYTCHTLYEYYSHYLPLPRPVALPLIRKTCAALANQCSGIITPTAATRNYLLDMGVQKPIRVIPTGIDERELTGGDPGWLGQRYGIKPGEKVVLSVGRLGPEKNTAFLVRCFAGLARKFPEARLVLVGTGPGEKELRELAADLGVGDRVVFTGLLGKKEVVHCYHGADIFALASISETQGLVIPEAMTAGLPVVAVRANGAAEMVRHGVDGYLTGLNEGEFTGRMVELLASEARRKKKGRRARLNARQLTARRYAEKVLEIYALLVRGDTADITGRTGNS